MDRRWVVLRFRNKSVNPRRNLKFLFRICVSGMYRLGVEVPLSPWTKNRTLAFRLSSQLVRVPFTFSFFHRSIFFSLRSSLAQRDQADELLSKSFPWVWKTLKDPTWGPSSRTAYRGRAFAHSKIGGDSPHPKMSTIFFLFVFTKMSANWKNAMS